MGGGEVARYITRDGQDRLHSVVFAAAVAPYMLQGGDNPEGPLTKQQAAEMTKDLTKDQDAFYDQFTAQFFSVDGKLQVSEDERQEALTQAGQADKKAALACMASLGTTDFRADLPHEAIPQSQLHVILGAPHGGNVSHAEEFNRTLVDFLGI
jgi:non-heme chloroperoxidase